MVDGERLGQRQAQNAEFAGDLRAGGHRNAWNACRLTRTISRSVSWSLASQAA
jgi:hypothetical protein